MSAAAAMPAEESLLDISLEEGMDRMDLDVLHREAGKRARAVNPAISDLRLAVDAAAEMQARHLQPRKLMLPLTGPCCCQTGAFCARGPVCGSIPGVRVLCLSFQKSFTGPCGCAGCQEGAQHVVLAVAVALCHGA